MLLPRFSSWLPPRNSIVMLSVREEKGTLVQVAVSTLEGTTLYSAYRCGGRPLFRKLYLGTAPAEAAAAALKATGDEIFSAESIAARLVSFEREQAEQAERRRQH